MSFAVHRIVRFAHVDAAGIVFYPRYFEMLNDAVEDYFAALGVSFADMHLRRGIGVPTVKLDVEFKAPSRLGDRLEFRLDVAAVGRSSATLDVAVLGEDGERLRARVTLVCMDLESGRPNAWPDDMRPRPDAPAEEGVRVA